ncbi:MAG: helix-turn-helix domain-containing protein [Helicobacteraceae bacterium]|jgi:transcriptional regulator with XRE-family HTH domain|nr:helix-turn-helix domain-containing protein [Helicobacteraceae bacterium]
MAKKNQLFQATPFAVESALKRLGQNLRTARLRRRLTQAQLSEKIGVGTRAISDAEKGKPTTAVSTYMALFWAFDLLDNIKDAADPLKDAEGLRLEALRAPRRARTPKSSELNNDF